MSLGNHIRGFRSGEGSINKINRLQLENGLRLLHCEVPKSSSVSLAISLEGGSREEESSQIGLTHLLEHMLFKRTVKRSSFDLACQIDRLGGDINAFTDTDELVLYGEVPPKGFSDLFGLFTELLFEPGFTEEDLKLEKEVILQEIADSDDDPDSAGFNLLSEIFWPNTSYGLPVFGTVSSVKSLSRDNVLERLDELLVGKRICISVAGAVSLKELKEKVIETFDTLETGDYLVRDKISPAFGQKRISRGVEQCHLSMGLEIAAPDKEDYPSALIFSNILGEGMSSRLFHKIREQRGLAYEVGCEIESSQDTAMLLVRASSSPEKMGEISRLIETELDSLKNLGPERGEIERAKESLIAQFQMQEGDLSSKIWRMIETERLFGRFVSAGDFALRISNISDDEIIQFVKKSLNEIVTGVVLSGAVEELEEISLEGLS